MYVPVSKPQCISPASLLYSPADSLHYSSAISVALALVFVFITVIVAIIGLAKGQLPAPSFVPDLTYTNGAIAIFTVIPVWKPRPSLPWRMQWPAYHSPAYSGGNPAPCQHKSPRYREFLLLSSAGG